MKPILFSLAGTLVMMALVIHPDLGYILVGIHACYRVRRWWQTRRSPILMPSRAGKTLP
ncbi:MAG: hypothetical protein AB7F75_12910 [Planctomycetota bacterium]